MIKNINKPTSPFWNKVIAICTTVSGVVASYALLNDNKLWAWIGGIAGMLGALIPIFMPNKEEQ